MAEDEFEAVLAERDPLKQAQRATELMAVYKDRAGMLSLIRSEAIERIAAERGISLTEVARLLGLSKGRITQIRTKPPRRRRPEGE